MNLIDTSLDVRDDAMGKDPDTHSAKLRGYHRLLWSKPLPNGNLFELTEKGPYLQHCSSLGTFVLSSDSVMQTFLRWALMKNIKPQLTEEEKEEFITIGYTIGAMMVFPANKVDGKPTINVARGFNRSISDRFDLTLECIRRHYLGWASPLSEALDRYRKFFKLFDDFHGYVDFFLLQDLVTGEAEYRSTLNRCPQVKFFMPFNNFTPPAVPRDVDTYREYQRRSIDFIKARNRRIDDLVYKLAG